ncbi:uncharacterized protein LOC101218541 isoform X1 [Cucumis sativus]|uniref:uncharacterized protein LOC101218541 isoform X1 n=1 Tax=Cucumis sativus TaxID=3659 RepID=UPI0002B47899|nr:uncharacterized protein LOC101218541 isoform X1 [Cucumis sativus]
MERKVPMPRNDREIMAPSSQIKRRKIDHPPSRRSSSSAAVERHGVLASTKGSTFPVASGSEFRMLQDKSSAIAEAKQDGCTGNFKVLDSPFGNFLLPVIPSSTEFFE